MFFARLLHESGEHSGEEPAEKVVTSKPSSEAVVGGSTFVAKDGSGAKGSHWPRDWSN